MSKPTYQEILNGIIQITSKYTVGIIVRGIPLDLILTSMRANLEKIRTADTYDEYERYVNDALASGGVGTFNDHITVQRDREDLYKLVYLWRGMLLEEESLATQATPPSS